MDGMKGLLGAMMEGRKKQLEDKAVPEAKKPTGNLADVLFRRKRDQEDDYQKVLDAEK